MSRLAGKDAAILAVLVPIWAVCFVLSAGSVGRGDGLSPVYVAAPEDPEGHPTLLGFRPWLGGEASGLEPGDRLLRLGGLDLRGVGPFGFWARVPEAAGPDLRAPVVYEREGVRGRTELPVGSLRVLWPYLLVSLAFALTGVALLVRGRSSPTVRALALASLVLAVNFASNFAGSRSQAWASMGVHALSMALLGPLALRAVALFPEGVPPVDRRLRRGFWVFALLGVFEAAHFNYGNPPLTPAVGFAGFFALAGLGFATALALLTRNWRRADPVGRRQLKWLVLGWYLALAPPIAASVLTGIDPRFLPVYVVAQLGLALVPLTLLVAVVRYNWFDVDRLLSATASYNVMGVLALGAILVGVPRLADSGAGALGLDPALSRAALALLVAGLAVAGHRRLRPRIEERFFPERYALDRGIEALVDELPETRDPRTLTEHVGARLHALLQPEATVVYGAIGESFVPVFCQGRAVPPGFDAASPLVATLRMRRQPVHLQGHGRRAEDPPLGPFDRAALLTLAAAVVVPLWRSDELVAFLCLGPKRSGDVYTRADLGLLTLLAAAVSDELGRFDVAEMDRQGRAMQQALRRYVPGAVVAQLQAGGDPAPGSRELAVLFVDLRGYTAYAEPRAADEIFSTVNRYTEAVSAIANRHGGHVVEFNGDGMMVVFGAPEPLPAKERAAVEAAREMLRAVASLGLGGSGGGRALAAAVGIATGETFVGNIRAADRLIWAAIGNTTNLAARLQSLARELEASVVMDETTWARAGAAAKGFQRRAATAIRGRSEPLDVYVLPVSEAEAA